MGQAKQRKQQLGDLYGTPAGCKKTIDFNFRWMQDDEIQPIKQWGKPSSKFVAATIDGEAAMLIVDPVIDQRGQFNSSMLMLGQKGAKCQLMQFKAAVHKAVNRFILENTDIVITAE